MLTAWRCLIWLGVQFTLERSEAYSAFENLDESLKGDRDVVLEALKLDFNIRDHLPKSLNDDDEIISKIFTSLPFYACWAMEFASERIRNSKDIVLTAVEKNGLALEFVSSKLQSDKEVVIAAVKQNGLALEFANNVFKSDTEVVKAAIASKDAAMRFVSKDLLNFWYQMTVVTQPVYTT